jgi:GTP pyrophosphokinase
MLLAMVADIRVVLLRLASRAQTLRFLRVRTTNCAACRAETLDIYAPSPTAWRVVLVGAEDLSFRFLEPEVQAHRRNA